MGDKKEDAGSDCACILSLLKQLRDSFALDALDHKGFDLDGLVRLVHRVARDL